MDSTMPRAAFVTHHSYLGGAFSVSRIDNIDSYCRDFQGVSKLIPWLGRRLKSAE